jgi:uncharacterized protein YkwD
MPRIVSIALFAAVVLLLVPGTTAWRAPVVAGTSLAMVVLPLPYRTTTAQTSWDLEVTTLNLMNNERVAAGLAPLMPHATMRAAARDHGREMFAYGYLSHVSRAGLTPVQRVQRRGVRVQVVGENIAYAADVREAHEALMASEAHRQNILLPDYRLVGIGVVDGGSLGVVIVENFGD